MSSGVIVQEADLGGERAVLVAALHRFLTPHLTPEQCERRFDWLYGGGPHGRPRAWIAREAGGAVIGAAAAFPRRLRLGTNEIAGWVLGDFCIHPEFRSLGPAVQLQRVFVDEAKAGRFRFWYDFPSAGMVAVHRRLAIRPTHEVIRMAKPLRVERKLEGVLRSRLLASFLAAPANWILGMRDTPRGGPDGCVFELATGRCGPDFTELDRSVGPGLGLSTVRSAEYLNWRYLDHPLQRYGILAARQRGELQGYVVFSAPERGTDAPIVDLVGADGSAVLPALVRALTARLRAAGVTTASFPLLATHAWMPWIRNLGFRPRERSPLVIAGQAGDAGVTHLERGGRWHLVAGDRDL
ncbi:MAG TPA: hypothetical protein VFP58_04760 [Candidatus Eisenbacteria bacterium]|nr:hypothetical protein [Candidatus Eisenbacteria bacterium]